MKLNNKAIFISTMAASLSLLFSCEDSDLLVDQITSEVQNGAVLRTISEEVGIFDRNDTSAEWSLEFEVQDEENGDLLEKVDFYIGFEDNTKEDDDNRPNGDQTRDSVLVQTFMPSDFTEGPFGLPRASVDGTFAEALTSLGLSDGEFDGDDQIIYSLVLTLTDGRVFDSNDNTGTITGSFFNAPFRYPVLIRCIPEEPVPGMYRMILNDSDADGWDGAFLTVNIDGTSTNYTVAEGSAAEFNFTVPEGTTTFTVTYTAGTSEADNTYRIISPIGETAAQDGPTPSTGEVVLSICI